jgi:hypothetical protein
MRILPGALLSGAFISQSGPGMSTGLPVSPFLSRRVMFGPTNFASGTWPETDCRQHNLLNFRARRRSQPEPPVAIEAGRVSKLIALTGPKRQRPCSQARTGSMQGRKVPRLSCLQTLWKMLSPPVRNEPFSSSIQGSGTLGATGAFSGDALPVRISPRESGKDRTDRRSSF